MKKPRSGRIDTSTGQNRRVKITVKGSAFPGSAPERNGGKIVPKGRLAHQRNRRTR